MLLDAPRVSGEYTVTLTLHGRHVCGSPHVVTILPPTAHLAHCEAYGDALTLSTAGELSVFNLLTHDAQGAIPPQPRTLLLSSAPSAPRLP